MSESQGSIARASWFERVWQAGEQWLVGAKRAQYGLAITRIVFGFVIAGQLLVTFSTRHYTWGVGVEWKREMVDVSNQLQIFKVLFNHSYEFAWDLFYVLLMLMGLAVMLGWRTRIMLPLLWFTWMSLYAVSPGVPNGGDVILRMCLLYLCFTDCGRRLSLDARRRRRQAAVRQVQEPQAQEPRDRRIPVWFGNLVHNLGLILIVHEIFVVYVASGLWKLRGETWMNGTAMALPLQTEAFTKYEWLNQLMISNGFFVAVATYASIYLQLLFPLLLIWRPLRIVTLIGIVLMHIGIALGMSLPFFSLVIIAVDAVFIRDVTWQKFGALCLVQLRRLQDRFGWSTGAAPPPADGTARQDEPAVGPQAKRPTDEELADRDPEPASARAGERRGG